MKIPEEAVIPDEKITCYLLVWKTRNDKSKFLAQAGFTQNKAEDLKLALQILIKNYEAVEDGENEYGIFYQVRGILMGINGVNLNIITIWLKRKVDHQFQFVTLKPFRGI
jgi:endonuclease III